MDGSQSGHHSTAPRSSVRRGAFARCCFFLGQLVSLDPESERSTCSFPWDTRFEVNAATPSSGAITSFISSGYGKGSALLKVVKGDGLSVEQVYKEQPDEKPVRLLRLSRQVRLRH